MGIDYATDGEQYANLGSTYQTADLQKITLQTKLDLRSKKREEQQQFLENKQK